MVKHSNRNQGDESQVKDFILLKSETGTSNTAFAGTKNKDQLIDSFLDLPQLSLVVIVNTFHLPLVDEVTLLVDFDIGLIDKVNSIKPTVRHDDGQNSGIFFFLLIAYSNRILKMLLSSRLTQS